MNNPTALRRGLAVLSLLTTSLLAEQVVFSEINYNPADGKPEYLEIRNLTATPFDIANWRISDGVDFEFPDFNARRPTAAFLSEFEYIIVAAVDEATLRASYTIPPGTKIFGPWTGALDNAGERLVLEDKNGILRAEVTYNDDGRKWPIAADGAGHTIQLARPNRGGSNWRNWEVSRDPDGTPGGPASTLPPLSALLDLSEIHFGPGGAVDWVELHAPGEAAVAVDTYSVASLKDFSNAVPLSGSVAAGGYASWNTSFPTDVDGDVEIYVIDAGGTVIAAQKFTRGPGQDGFQSLPVGEEWFGGSGHTRNAPNNPTARNTNVVINEIMYDTPSDARTGEFVELYNRGGTQQDLSGWSFVDGIDFTFPTGTILNPGAYLVVAADASWLANQYGSIQILGDFTGQLSDSGELIRLEDAAGNLVDEVDYLPSGDWPELADGDGSSMELKHPSMNNDSPSAWSDSDETNKSTMQDFSYTANFDQATWNPITSGQEMHLHLVGDSHLVIESPSLELNADGNNLLLYPGSMSRSNSSSRGWVEQGTHWETYMDRTVTPAQIHIISDGHGDNKANRVEIDTGNLSFNQSYTFTFRGRWISGKPRLIVQTLDHGFGTSFRLPIPNNLGTPGMANSRLISSPAPTVSGVVHSPAVPSTTDEVTITARVESSAALSSVEVVHRLDTIAGNGAWLRTPMYDDGINGGDEHAGDGLYTAVITQYTAQANIVQFYVEALAAGGATTQLPKLGPNRPALWIVDGRTMPATLMQERFIVSQYDREAMNAISGDSAPYGYHFPRMSNHFFNATFISNESEVFYNAEIRKSGSPFTRSSNNDLTHGKWKLPGDRLFRERSRTVFDPSGDAITPRYYDDRLARHFLYLLGHPTNEMEFVHWVVNGDAFKLRENQEPISNDFLKRNWEGGTKGTLLRVDDEWRFTSDDGNARQSRNADWSYKNSANPIRYHSEWLMRSRESDYDYGNFVEFVRTLDSNTFDEPTISRLADRDMLCLNAAVRGYDADWDTLTVNRGKNAYFYRPKGGRWMLIHWDGDRVFDNVNQTILGSLPGVPTYFNKPYNRRVLNYYLTELLDKYTKDSYRTNAWMDAETLAVAGSGITMTKSHYQNWFANRESTANSFIGSALNATFAITTSNAPTSAATISLTGTSPSTVYEVRVDGQPWVMPTWSSTTNWSLPGIILKTGSNTIKVEGINHEGTVVTSGTIVITKTGNALPVMALEGDPASFNVGLVEGLGLDATASYDPDGGGLSFDWALAPAAGATLAPAAGLASAGFSKPGLYEFTVTGTDPDTGSADFTREAAVYGGGGFSKFNGPLLEPYWETSNLQLINNLGTGPWYSLEYRSGHLLLGIPGHQRYPLGDPGRGGDLDSVTHPWLKRELPSAGEWVLQTDLELSGLQFGDFMTGLLVEVGGPAARNRYAIGYQNGNQLAVVQINESADTVSLFSLPYGLRSDMQLRIRREGNELVFEWRPNELFEEVHRLALPAGNLVFDGGPFAATEAEEILNVTFDYVMLIDPTPIVPPSDALVISEILYKPLEGDLYEFLELHNTGPTSIDLTGFRFPQGAPFDEFVFGGITIGPGEHRLVVHNLAAFRSRYGEGLNSIIAGEWIGGNLSNSSETITLLDAEGNTVFSFDYSDSPPWPTSPDNDGTSLVLIDPVNGDMGNGSDWTASSQPGGSPGYSELSGAFSAWLAARGETDPLATKAGELVNNLLAYAFGLDLAGGDASVALPKLGAMTIDDDTFLTFEYRRRISDPSIGYMVEISRDGQNWANAAADIVEVSGTDEGDGTERIIVRLLAPLGSEELVLLRVRVTPGAGDTGALFDAWMADRGETDPLATKAGEPMSNLLAYAFGLDLAGGDAGVALPISGEMTILEETFLTLSYRRRLSDPGIGYTVQTSRNGFTWADGSADIVEVSTLEEGDGTERVTIRLGDPLGTEDILLIRVLVTAP
ncbi:MAG: lamin tail domain-containing protein [Verrucomicrobia bacterium]|nr:lamin tail domain-containing protein [Verrucomicrobiota bacterium]